MNLGIFGGSFDPIHVGHLLLAETCRESCGLDEVWFLPASRPPHKQERPLADGRHRLEMIRLAIAAYPPFHVSEIEILRGGTSYTVETLTEIAADRPNDRLYFLMGADSLDEFSTWREPAEICRLALPVIVRRHGSPAPDLSRLADLLSPESLAQVRSLETEFPIVEISSTEIRRRVAEDRSIRYRVPRAVEEYIRSHQLYRQG